MRLAGVMIYYAQMKTLDRFADFVLPRDLREARGRLLYHRTLYHRCLPLLAFLLAFLDALISKSPPSPRPAAQPTASSTTLAGASRALSTARRAWGAVCEEVVWGVCANLHGECVKTHGLGARIMISLPNYENTG